MLAIAGAIPEMNHNEIEVWGGPGAAGRHAVLLREDARAPRDRAAFHACCARCSGPTPAASARYGRVAVAAWPACSSLAALGQWVSYYVAMLQGTDPWPVPVLDRGEAPAGDAIGEQRSAPLRARATPC